MSDHHAPTDAGGGRVADADADEREPGQDERESERGEREPDADAVVETGDPDPAEDTPDAEDATDPDTTGPDTTGPDTTGPDTTGPDTTGPDTTGQDAADDTAQTVTTGTAPDDVAVDSTSEDVAAETASMDVTLVAVSAGGPVREPSDEAVLASAPGVGTRVGAVNVTILGPFGWLVMAAGIAGTLLIAVSYLAGWLTASLENFGVAETESLGLEAATSTPLAWMYRLATLALIGCATGLVFAPRPARPLLRVGGFAAAGLSLFTALIATLVIATALARGSRYFGDASSVGYGWGFYCGLFGIVALTVFLGFFQRIAAR